MAETIVVVDAEPVVRNVLAATLERAGYVVHDTDDVQTALELCATKSLPDSNVIQHWVGEDGFDAFPKPFMARDLVAKVKDTLANRRESARDQ
jgi:hypothetical protein